MNALALMSKYCVPWTLDVISEDMAELRGSKTHLINWHCKCHLGACSMICIACCIIPTCWSVETVESTLIRAHRDCTLSLPHDLRAKGTSK